MATTQTQRPTQRRTQRNGSFTCYVGEKGYEAVGRKHDGSPMYLLFADREEFVKTIISRFKGKTDKHGQPCGWRTYRTNFGPETVIDGLVERADGKVWEVTLTGNCALALVSGYDNRPPSRQAMDVSVIDEEIKEEEAEEDLI